MLKKCCLILLVGFVLISLDFTVTAQSKKNKVKGKKGAATPTQYENFPSAKNPGNSQASYNNSRRSIKKGNNKNNLMHQLDQKVEEYHQRVKDAQKRYKKMDRISQKPQYSDPTYFGHKKKPKKRAPGKKKVCKECGILH